MVLPELRKKIEEKTAVLGVIGLGYVGLPVAALFAEKGFRVIGIDLKADRVAVINSGSSPIEGKEPGLDDLIKKVVTSGKLKASTNYDDLKAADVVLIDVETPVNDAHVPEYKALRSALASLSKVLKAGALVVVESTIMPGTMAKIVLPALEAGIGTRCGEGFYLGNCPERVMPGKLLNNLRIMSRIAGGDSEATAETMARLYKQIVEADVDTGDWITAEIVKTAENSYRDVQIAFVNELALICEALGADVWKVRAFVRKVRKDILFPGAGVGGHCIPKDPWLLVSSVRETDVPIRLIPMARAVNTGMPGHMLDLLKAQIGDLKEKTVLVLGYAYLADSDDTRNSPSAELEKLLNEAGASVRVHDPYIAEYAGDVYAQAVGCDAAALMTAHAEYRSLDLVKMKNALKAPVVIDGRNVIREEDAADAGVRLVRLGVGGGGREDPKSFRNLTLGTFRH